MDATTTLTYDALGRMVEQNKSGVYTQVAYSPAGGKLALMNGQTLSRAFVPLPAGSQAVYLATGLTFYRHGDWLGSSRFASTPVRGCYYDLAYAPFGEDFAHTMQFPCAKDPVDLDFTGQNQDTVSGMYDFLYREYAPTQGRWISPDPAGAGAVDPMNPQTWNRYAYVANNPLSATDPEGLDMCMDGACILVSGGGGNPFYAAFGGHTTESDIQMASVTSKGYGWVKDSFESIYEYWASLGPMANGFVPWGWFTPIEPGSDHPGHMGGGSGGELVSSPYSQAAMVAIHNAFTNFPDLCNPGIGATARLGSGAANLNVDRTGTDASITVEAGPISIDPANALHDATINIGESVGGSLTIDPLKHTVKSGSVFVGFKAKFFELNANIHAAVVNMFSCN